MIKLFNFVSHELVLIIEPEKQNVLSTVISFTLTGLFLDDLSRG